MFDSCKKNSPIPSPAPVTGEWTWIQTYPGGNPASYPYYPFTPQNTGTREKLTFQSNQQFTRTMNDTLIQTGTYTTGHGSYIPYTGSHSYIFDSICYFENGTKTGVDYYSILHGDTLVYSGAFAGIIGGGSKYYEKN